MALQPKFITLSEKKVIGISGKFISIMSEEHNNDIVIPQLWDTYIKRRNEIEGAVAEYDLGVISPVLPPDTKTHPAEMLYMAGTEVNSLDNVPAGMTAKTIPAGNYAVFTHRGPINKFADTMLYIFDQWLPTSGKQIRKAPELEIYDHRFNPTADDSEMEICIPVE